ncbi:MAG: ATP-binding protein [bacterium]
MQEEKSSAHAPGPEASFFSAAERAPRLALKLVVVAGSILLISSAHYSTSLHLHRLHAIYDRLYYLPIFAAAVWFGLRGGLAASIGSSLLYAPHIFFQWKLLPAAAPERYLEILLFNVVGGLTGFLAERAHRQSALAQRTSRELARAYDGLKETSSRLLTVEQRLRIAEKHFALGELSATVTHEFMNPLGSIRGAAEILSDEFPEGHEKHAFLKILVQETERLERTARSILRFGRQVHLDKTNCRPNELIETVLLLVREEAAKRGVRIRTELAGSVRAMPLDEDKIEQVLLNLVTNALQAMPQGGTLTIRSEWNGGRPPPITGEAARQGLLISVEDTGAGIPADQIHRIFGPFYTTKPEGTGLGLAIVKRIVETHGGHVTVESVPARGSSFSVWLPAEPR